MEDVRNRSKANFPKMKMTDKSNCKEKINFDGIKSNKIFEVSTLKQGQVTNQITEDLLLLGVI